ncbi:MAG: hypothetical protein EBU93_06580, partial [Chlamydiae bacterium]|nr:hypothetical protein [Chlamydiota bacterium]
LFKLEDYTPHEPIPGPLLHPLTYQQIASIKEALKKVGFSSMPVSKAGRTNLEALYQAIKLLTEATPIFAIIELESKKEPLSHLESLTLKFLKEFATIPFETLKHKINFIIQSIIQNESSPEDLMYADSQSFFLQ